jgi:hypothetical protein
LRTPVVQRDLNSKQDAGGEDLAGEKDK